MLRILGWALYILIVGALTALTQVGGAILLFSIRKNCLTGSANHSNQECRRICRRYWLNRTQVG